MFKRVLWRLGYDIRKVDTHNKHLVKVSLGPKRPKAGWVLLAYVIDPFLLREGEPIPNHHTNCWESLQIAQTYLELGYSVDVISYLNEEFHPERDYSIFVCSRVKFQTLAERLNGDCRKVVHLDTAHWLFNNTASYARCMALRERRGVAIEKSMRLVGPNRAIELADCAAMLGNDFTRETYSFAQKPIVPLPVPAVNTLPWPEKKDFELCRRRFIWLGSGGLVHKGLDLVLEAFAEMPDLHLTVCGPVDRESEFQSVYRKELYETSNIEVRGWVDVTGPEFTNIVSASIGLVYPSCSEGQAGAVVTCMQAGMLPIISYESGVDVHGFGHVLRESTKESVKQAVQSVASCSPQELQHLSRTAWEYARRNHTREHYAEVYRNFALSMARGQDPSSSVPI